jgi:CBS domain-containing membrane protein
MTTVTVEKLTVRDLMTDKVVAANRDDTLETLHELMQDRGFRHMPVVDDEGILIGLVSHRDLLRHALIEQSDVPRYVEKEVLRQLTAIDVMTETVETADPDTDIRVAAQTMFENKFGCLPVVEGERLVGILTESDFVRFMAHGH